MNAAEARSTARSLLLASELEKILGAADEAGLEVLPLRGPALGEALWGDAALRPSGDLDLLVRPRDLAALSRLLEGLGFHQVDAADGWAREFDYALEFFKRGGSPAVPALPGAKGPPTKPGPFTLIVEPHWSLAYPPFVASLDMDGVWARCGRASFAGRSVLALAPEDLLLHLALHALHQEPDAPRLWYQELDRLIRRTPELDWAALEERASEAGLAPHLGRALSTASALAGTPLPEGLCLRLEARRAASPGLYRLLLDRSDISGRERLALLWTLPGLGPRLRYLRAYLWPDAAFMREQCGAGERLFSARLSRLARLAGLALRAAWPGRRGRGSPSTTLRAWRPGRKDKDRAGAAARS